MIRIKQLLWQKGRSAELRFGGIKGHYRELLGLDPRSLGSCCFCLCNQSISCSLNVSLGSYVPFKLSCDFSHSCSSLVLLDLEGFDKNLAVSGMTYTIHPFLPSSCLALERATVPLPSLLLDHTCHHSPPPSASVLALTSCPQRCLACAQWVWSSNVPRYIIYIHHIIYICQGLGWKNSSALFAFWLDPELRSFWCNQGDCLTLTPMAGSFARVQSSYHDGYRGQEVPGFNEVVL